MSERGETGLRRSTAHPWGGGGRSINSEDGIKKKRKADDLGPNIPIRRKKAGEGIRAAPKNSLKKKKKKTILKPSEEKKKDPVKMGSKGRWNS